jgi:hypothetical protein
MFGGSVTAAGSRSLCTRRKVLQWFAMEEPFTQGSGEGLAPEWPVGTSRGQGATLLFQHSGPHSLRAERAQFHFKTASSYALIRHFRLTGSVRLISFKYLLIVFPHSMMTWIFARSPGGARIRSSVDLGPLHSGMTVARAYGEDQRPHVPKASARSHALGFSVAV